MPVIPIKVGDTVIYDNGEGIPNAAVVIGIPANGVGVYLSVTGNPLSQEYVPSQALAAEGTGPNTWSRP